MGLERLLKNRFVRSLGLAAGIATTMLAGGAGATEVMPLGAARVAGSQGSDWHDRQLLKDRGSGSSFTLYLTERGQTFNPETDPQLHVTLQPGQTQTLEELYEQLKPGVAGAATVRLVPDEGSDAPVWRSYMFNKDGTSEFGMSTRPFSEETDGYHSTGSVLGTTLSPDGFRDNLDITTGDAGAVIAYQYTNSAGGNAVEKKRTYDPNTTVQTPVQSLLGFEPEPGSSLEATITSGTGRVYLSRNNNESNDPARDEMEWLRTTNGYDITVWIQVIDNGQGYSQTTHPSADIIKRIWQVNTLAALEGSGEYVCNDLPDPVVNSLPEVISNYNGLTAVEQEEFSGDRIGFQPFANDGDNDGLPCDDDEPDHQYVNIIRLTVTPQ